MNEAVWFVLIEGKKEGPFAALQLRHDYRINPDTLVSKAEWTNWIPIREVEELAELFKDAKTQEELLPKPKKPLQPIGKEELALDIQKDPIPTFVWIIILLIIFYLLYEFQK